MSIKPETVQAIKESKLIMSSFEKYGSKSKISLTWHTDSHSFTIQGWVKISFNKHIRLSTWDQLYSLLKPNNFSAVMEDKATQESKFNEDQDKCREVFKTVCDELARRTDSVIVDQYIINKTNI